MLIPNERNVYWFFMLILISMALLFSLKSVAKSAEIKVPKGLSDTAFTRQFDRALEDAEPNTDITWDTGYDTPTAQQVYQLFLNYTTFSSSDTGTYDAQYDTRTLSRSDVSVKLNIIEKFDTQTRELIDYYKNVEIDT